MRHHLPLQLLLASLVALLVSCGGGSDPQALTDAGYAAFGEGDHAAAKKSFESALAELDSSDPLYLDARLGAVRAQAYLEPKAGREAFVELEKASRGKLTLGNYTQVAADLATAKAYVEAAEVLKVGKAAYPEAEQLAKLVQDMGRKAEQAGDDDAVAAFKSLGYVGGD